MISGWQWNNIPCFHDNTECNFSYTRKSSYNIYGFMQNCSNSIANALELLQSCTKPSILRIELPFHDVIMSLTPIMSPPVYICTRQFYRIFMMSWSGLITKITRRVSMADTNACHINWKWLAANLLLYCRDGYTILLWRNHRRQI